MTNTKQRTRCQYCLVPFNVPSGLLGKTVKCPKCAKSFIVEIFEDSFAGANAMSVDQASLSTSEKVDSETIRTQARTTSKLSKDVEDTSASERRSLPIEKTIGQLGRFELKAILGQGAFGRVFRAYDPQLDRMLALKVPLFAEGERQKAARFQAEAKAAGRLHHPNIVPTFDSGRVDNQFYIASQFIEGKTLSSIIKDKPIQFTQAAKWTVSIARALAYAHDMGIVHRDVKPQNIMLDSRSEPQLMDFGLAKRVNEDSGMTTEGALLGTPAYMSPEQARGDTVNIGPRSDQYAVGVILYELLSGQRPFDGPPHAVIAQILTSEPTELRQLNPTIPLDLSAIAQKSMHKDIARRYESCTELGEDLERWLRGEATLARPASNFEKLVRWSQRHRQLAIFIATLSVVLLLAMLAISSAFVTTSIAKAQADKNLIEAEQQTAIAVLEKQRADRSLVEAEQQTALALVEKKRADEKSEEAMSNLLLMERAKSNAEEAASKARNLGYQPVLRRIYSAYQDGIVGFEKARFEKIPPQIQGWERSFIANLLRDEATKITIPGTSGFSDMNGIELAHFSVDGSVLIYAIRGGAGKLTVCNPRDGSTIREIGLNTKQPVAAFAIDATSTWVVALTGIGPSIGEQRENSHDLCLANIKTGGVSDQQAIKIVDPFNNTSFPAQSMSTLSFDAQLEHGTIVFSTESFEVSISSDKKFQIKKGESDVGKNKNDERIELLKKKYPNGRMVRSTSDDFAFLSDGDRTQMLIDCRGKGFKKVPIDLPNNCGLPTSFALNKAGSELALGLEDRSILVWSVSENRKLTSLKPQGLPIIQLEYSPVGDVLYCQSMLNGCLHRTTWSDTSYVSVVDVPSKVSQIYAVQRSFQRSPEVVLLTKGQELIFAPLRGKGVPKRIATDGLEKITVSVDGLYFGGYNATSKEVVIAEIENPRRELARIKNVEMERLSESLRQQWDTAGGPPVRMNRFGGIAFDVKEKVAVVSGETGITTAYDFSGEKKWSMDAKSPTGAPIIAHSHGVAVSGGLRKKLNMVDLNSGKETQDHRFWQGFIQGPVLAFANQSLDVVSTVEAHAMEHFGKFSKGSGMMFGHVKAITHAAVSNDDKRVFTGSSDGTVRIWNTEEHRDSGAFGVPEYDEMLTLCRFDDPVGGLCLFEDGMVLVAVSESGEVKVFDARNPPSPN